MEKNIFLQQYASGKRLFENEKFQGIDLSGELIADCHFKKCNFLWANASNSHWQNVLFDHCILRAANFGCTTLNNVQLKECNLIEANFAETNFEQVTLLGNCRINTNFAHAHLAGIDFSGLTIEGSNFAHANLSHTCFCNTHLSGIDFSGADLRYADFSGAVGIAITIDPQTQLADSCGTTFLLPPPPSIAHSLDWHEGYAAGYALGYPTATAHSHEPPPNKELVWQDLLMQQYPAATDDFRDGFQTGFLFSYREGSVS